VGGDLEEGSRSRPTSKEGMDGRHAMPIGWIRWIAHQERKRATNALRCHARSSRLNATAMLF